jgi:hypothetical protein
LCDDDQLASTGAAHKHHVIRYPEAEKHVHDCMHICYIRLYAGCIKALSSLYQA